MIKCYDLSSSRCLENTSLTEDLKQYWEWNLFKYLYMHSVFALHSQMRFAWQNFLCSVDMDLLCIRSNFSDRVRAIQVVVSVIVITVYLKSEVKWSKEATESRRLCSGTKTHKSYYSILWQRLKRINKYSCTSLLDQPISYKWATHVLHFCCSLIHQQQPLGRSPRGKERPNCYCQLIFACSRTDNECSVEKLMTFRSKGAQK